METRVTSLRLEKDGAGKGYHGNKQGCLLRGAVQTLFSPSKHPRVGGRGQADGKPAPQSSVWGGRQAAAG